MKKHPVPNSTPTPEPTTPTPPRSLTVECCLHHLSLMYLKLGGAIRDVELGRHLEAHKILADLDSDLWEAFAVSQLLPDVAAKIDRESEADMDSLYKQEPELYRKAWLEHQERRSAQLGIVLDWLNTQSQRGPLPALPPAAPSQAA